MKIGDRIMVDPNTQFYRELRGKKGTVVDVPPTHDALGNLFIDVRMDDPSMQIVPFYPEELIKLSEED